MRFLYKTRRQLVIWLFSYIVVIVVLLSVNLAAHVAVTNLFREELKKSNHMMVAQIKDITDSALDTVEQSAYQLINAQTVQNLASQRREDYKKREEWAKSLMQDLKLLLGKQTIISNAFLLFRDSNVCVDSGSMFNQEIFYQMFFERFYSSKEACINDLFISQLKEYKLIQTSDGVQKILFLYSYPVIGERKSAVAVFELDLTELVEKIGLSDSALIFLDDENRIWLSAGVQPSCAVRCQDVRNGRQVRYGDKTCVEYIARSDKLGLNYIYLLENSAYARKLRWVQGIFLASYLLCFILGGILAFYFSKRNHRPVEKLVMKLQKEKGAVNTQPEFEYIENALNDIFAYSNVVKKKLDYQTAKLKNAYLAKILQGKLPVDQQAVEKMTSFGIFLDGRYTVLVLFYILEIGAEDGGEGMMDSSVFYAIENVFTELLEDFATAYFCEMDDSQVAIISCNDPASDWKNIIKKAKWMTSFLQEQLNVAIVCGISQLTENIAQLPELYRQSQEILDYRLVVKDKGVLTYDDVMHNSGVYELTLEQVNQLTNCLALGDAENANEIIRQIIDRNLSNQGININMLRIMLAELTGVILRAGLEIDHKGRLDVVGFSRIAAELTDIVHLPALADQIEEFVEKICSISREHQANAEDVRCSKIQGYIQEHYSDPTLSVGKIADAFGLSANYISKQFKQQTDVALSVYIMQVRLDMAKQLLKKTEKTVAQIAEETGFYTATVFIRAFKKREGVTPGQYKEIKNET